MTTPEYKSECCGAEVEKKLIYHAEVDKWGRLDWSYTNCCSKCHKPTTVRKEEG